MRTRGTRRSATKLGKDVGYAWSPLRDDDPDFDPPKRGADLEQDWLLDGKPVRARELDLQPTGQNHGPELKFQAADLDAHDGDATVDDHDDVELAEDGD